MYASAIKVGTLRFATLVLAWIGGPSPLWAASQGEPEDPTGVAGASVPAEVASPPAPEAPAPAQSTEPVPSEAAVESAPVGEVPPASVDLPASHDPAASAIETPAETSTAAPAEPSPVARANDPWANTYDPYVDSPEAVLYRAQIRGGSILLGAGVLLGAGAVALGLSDPCSTAAGNSCDSGSRNRAAITMAVPAAVMVATGGAMLAIGLQKRKAFHATMALHREGGGVAVFGRF